MSTPFEYLEERLAAARDRAGPEATPREVMEEFLNNVEVACAQRDEFVRTIKAAAGKLHTHETLMEVWRRLGDICRWEEELGC